jgi:sec-independent protein translocase protein TatC
MTAIDDPATAAPEPTDDGLGSMTLVEHLVELRRRLLICVLAVVVATVAAWVFYNKLLAFMRTPYCNFVNHHPSNSISVCNLVTTGPLEGFTTRVKLSAYAGIALATPVGLWELWKFITPGLHKNEKRYIVPFVAGAVALFALGVTTAILVFPKALDWLISVSGQGIVPCSPRAATSPSTWPWR